MIRMLLFLIFLAGVVYWLVSLYSRSLRTERLEKMWAEEQPEGIDRDAYVQAGLERYDRSFRRKLILLILVLPFLAVLGAIYAQNFMGYR